MKKFIIHFGFLILSLVIAGGAAVAQTSEFTYQGRLVQAGNPVTGTRAIQFYLFDENGVQIPGAVLERVVTVTNGNFSATLDFGAAAFASGANRSLQIAVQTNPNDIEDGFTFLTPRQPIHSAPYAIKSKSADDANRLGGAAANQFVQTNDSRLTDQRTPTAGSGFYIQNTPPTQQAANFNISGNGFVGGNLGIGTTSPLSKLTLQTPTNNYGFLQTDGAITFGSFVGGTSAPVGGWFGTTTNHPLHFFTNNGEARMTITQAGNVGIGTANPVRSLDVRGSMVIDTGGNANIFTASSGGEQNRYVALFNSPTTQTASGLKTGGLLVSDDYGFASPGKNDLIVKGNVGIGTATPQSKLEVFTASNSNGFSHSDGTTRLSSFVGPGSFGTRGGWLGTTSFDPLFLYANNGNPSITIRPEGRVAIGNIDTDSTLSVNGKIYVNGTISYFNSPSFGSDDVCRNSARELAFCSSSFRYKTNIQDFRSGLEFVNKLNPISYDWKDGGKKDVGFGAEDVEKIDPRFVSYNDEGLIEGVKYNRLSVVFVNAFREQQAQIERQQKQIEALTRLVCLQNPEAEICREQK